jgi:uncharacterized membrane protein YgcG
VSASGGLMSQLLSSPEFWLAAPAVVALVIFGLVALVALIRAARQDVPMVFGTFSSVFTRRSGQVEASGDRSRLPSGDPAAEKQSGTFREVGHSDESGGAS